MRNKLITKKGQKMYSFKQAKEKKPCYYSCDKGEKIKTQVSEIRKKKTLTTIDI